LTLEHWETYYRGGLLATCPTGPHGGYDLELRDAWSSFFGELPDGARILDIGTGNGAVAAIARDTASGLGRGWEIHASDLARIDPMRDVPDAGTRLSGIVFHPGVATERLPFDDASFDAVSGHYALEYAELAPALAELHRVLRPGGKAQFVIHHADSPLVLNARWSLRESEFVLKDTMAYRRLRRVVLAENPDAPATRRAVADLRAAIHALRQALEQARQAGAGRVLAVTLDAIRQLLEARRQARPDAVAREVDHAEGELRASVRRLNDLVARARDEAGMVEIERLAGTAGFDVLERTPQTHAGSNVVGWRLRLQRRA